jgi:hypothetical protein
MDVCLLCSYVVLSCVGRGLWDGMITGPEQSYRVSVCVWSRYPEKGGKRSVLDYKRMWMNDECYIYSHTWTEEIWTLRPAYHVFLLLKRRPSTQGVPLKVEPTTIRAAAASVREFVTTRSNRSMLVDGFRVTWDILYTCSNQNSSVCNAGSPFPYFLLCVVIILHKRDACYVAYFWTAGLSLFSQLFQLKLRR